jgi:hypothetical protein
MVKLKLTETNSGETGEDQSKEYAHHFFCQQGIHKEFILRGQAANSAYCCDILRLLRENVQRLRLKLWRITHFLFHQGILTKKDDRRPSSTLLFSASPIEEN